jgi:hypothetical protein
MRRAFVVSVLLLASVSCGGDDGGRASPSASEGCRAASAGRVTIVAEDLAWDAACLALPADVPITIVVDNRDAGVNHDFKLSGAGGVGTELETGPVQQELSVTLPTGTYPYRCSIHPNMEGAVQVS